MEILAWLRRIAGLNERIPGALVVCTSSGCTALYGVSIQLSWTSDGLLEEVRVTGYDGEGRQRTFRRTLTWENGLLTSVSAWEEVS